MRLFKKRPTFTYRERVRVVNGFFAGQVGTVVMQAATGHGYHVRLDDTGVSHPLWIDALDIQRLGDEDQPPHIRKIITEARA